MRARPVRPPAARRALGEALARALLAWPGLARARRVALFASLPDEPDTGPLDAALSAQGRDVLYPRCEGERLVFVASRREVLVAGRYGVREPAAGLTAEALRSDDLVCVPGLAFDREGRRLGRGGGYYDRLLAEARRASRPPVFLGIAEPGALVERVPAEAHDQPVDWLLGPGGVLGGRLAAAPERLGRAGREDEG